MVLFYTYVCIYFMSLPLVIVTPLEIEWGSIIFSWESWYIHHLVMLS